MGKILIIDDEKSIRNSLRDILEYEKYEVAEAENGAQGIKMIQQGEFDMVLCDIKMPKMDGIEVLEKALLLDNDTPIVMISGHGDIETAVEAIKKGAYDYIAKPLDLNRLLVVTRNALNKTSLISETKVLRKKINKQYEMIGESKEITMLKELIEKVAPTDARVLITGENGTGKEVVARWLHEKSERASGPFVEVNCAAIPSELIESELFGHEKGAFTSAIKQRKGNFEQAEGGTLFLDEIGDMSLSAQAKVLRALQENKIMRVGGEKDIKVNVRVLAATNKIITEEIEKGRFREDLYHRLSVILLNVPPLGKRKEDIPLLAAHFSSQICKEHGVGVKSFAKDALEAMKKLSWTGNIRELRNVVERLIILGGDKISAKDVTSFVNPLKDK
jgi:DNA-binding NtrC family response regulator